MFLKVLENLSKLEKLTKIKTSQKTDPAMAQNFETFFYSNGGKFVKGKDRSGTLIKTNRILDGEFKSGKLWGENENDFSEFWLNFLTILRPFFFSSDMARAANEH